MDHEDGGAYLRALETEVKKLRAEHEAQERQADLLRRVFEAIPAAISYHGRDQRVTMINPALARVLGKSTDALIGHRPGELFPAYASLFDRILGACLERGETFQGNDIEFPDPQAEGRPLIGDVAAVPVFDADGQVEGALLMTVDTTARVEKERWQAELIAQLRAVDRSKDEFLGVLSHELRTPLNGIIGFTSVLEDGLVGPIAPELRAYLERIDESTERMLGIIDELVTMAQLLIGKLALVAEPSDVAVIAHQVIARMAPAAAKKEIVLENRVPAGLRPVSADPQRLDQVLGTLIDNAIKFSRPGGRIVVTAREAGACLRCEVEDSGVGIAPIDHARIFERFYQVNGSSTRVAGGLGLGLAIAKALVEAQGGRIGVDSAPGRGSTFWFELPHP